MADEKDTTTENEAVQEKKPKLKLIIIAVLVLVLGAGGFFGWRTLSASKNADGTAVEATKAKELPGLIYPLKSFIVNLMDKAGVGRRYLKVTMEVEIGGEEEQELLDKYSAPIRDTILILLSSQRLTEINSMEGKVELKHRLLTRMNRILGESIVRHIYFTEFVVQ